jgi:hypothetical protein
VLVHFANPVGWAFDADEAEDPDEQASNEGGGLPLFAQILSLHQEACGFLEEDALAICWFASDVGEEFV